MCFQRTTFTLLVVNHLNGKKKHETNRFVVSEMKIFAGSLLSV